MGRKGAQRHLKRLPAPKTFPISRKQEKFTIRSSPGPHKLNTSIPLLIIIRDILKHASNGREAKHLITEGNYSIDGRVIKDYRFPVGIMDVLTIPKADEQFRILPNPRTALGLHPITTEESTFKLLKIVKKSAVKGGLLQLNLHDGRNKLLRNGDLETVNMENCAVGSTIKMSVPDQGILDIIPREPGVSTIVTAGRNIGLQGKLLEIEKQLNVATAVLESEQEGIFRTALEYIFVVGLDAPDISIPT